MMKSLTMAIAMAMAIVATAKPATPRPESGDSAATVSPETQAQTDPQNGDLPTHERVAEIHILNGTGALAREFSDLGIYPKAGTNSLNELFITPVFAQQSIESEPSVNDGMATVIVRYMLSDKLVRQAATKQLIDERGGTPKVWAWPVTGRMVYVLRTRTNQPVAKAVQTVSSREQIEFVFDVPEKVATQLKEHPERFVADFYYAAHHLNYAKGTLTIEGSKTIGMCLEDVIKSRDPSLDKKDLVGQLVIGDEHAELERRVAALLTKKWEAEHPDALPFLERQTPMLVDRLIAGLALDEMTYETLISQMNREDINGALRRYLEPRINIVNKNRAGDERELKINETSKTESGGGAGGVNLLIVSFGVGKETTERTLERLEKGTGMSWQCSETEGVFKPHRLKVSRVRKGYDAVEFKEQSIVYVPLTSTGGYLTTANVPCSFTATVALDSLKSQNLLDGIDHGIGAVVFTLNDQPPGPNWVEVGSNVTFPNEPQIPTHLRGKKVPDMRDCLIGVTGSSELQKIGARTEGTLAEQRVEGFKLPKPTEDRLYADEGTATRSEWRGGWVSVFQPNGDYLDVKSNAAPWGCFGGSMHPRPAIDRYHSENTTVNGVVIVKPPTHVMLRAYVRIR